MEFGGRKWFSSLFTHWQTSAWYQVPRWVLGLLLWTPVVLALRSLARGGAWIITEDSALLHVWAVPAGSPPAERVTLWFCANSWEVQTILWHQLGVLQFNWILMLTTWRQHLIPQVKSSAVQDCRSPPQFRCQSQVHVAARASVWLAIGQRFQWRHSLPWVQLIWWSGSQNLETFYLLDYQFIIKGYNSEQPDERGTQGKVCGKGVQSFWAPCRYHSPQISCVHQPRSAPNPVLLSFSGGFLK